MFKALNLYSEITDLIIDYFFEKTIVDCFDGMEKGKYDMIGFINGKNRKSADDELKDSRYKNRSDHAKTYAFNNKVNGGSVFFFLSNKSPFFKFPNEMKKSIEIFF